MISFLGFGAFKFLFFIFAFFLPARKPHKVCKEIVTGIFLGISHEISDFFGRFSL